MPDDRMRRQASNPVSSGTERIATPVRHILVVAASATLCATWACERRSTSEPTAAPECTLPEPTGFVPVEDPAPGERHAVYELPDMPALWMPAPNDPAVQRYHHEAAARLEGDTDPRTLLQRQERFFRDDGDGANIRAVLDGRVGSLVPASCLEMLLWRETDRQFPMLAHPTELGAFVLRRSGRVRVYLSTNDRMGQKLRGAVTARVRADQAEGWTLVAHLHNHPFLFDRRVGDRLYTTEATRDDVAGALAPSTNDVAFYRSWSAEAPLEAAWITNGFDSIRIPAAQLLLLEAAAPPGP